MQGGGREGVREGEREREEGERADTLRELSIAANSPSCPVTAQQRQTRQMQRPVGLKSEQRIFSIDEKNSK